MSEALLSVAAALERVLAQARPVASQALPLAECYGRTLAQDLASRRTQPPFPVSAMDGYAVRAQDCASPAARLRQIGVSSAGHRFHGAVGAGEAVRIFTGAVAPQGADAVLIQEHASARGEEIAVLEPVASGRNIRPAGLDFSQGEVLLRAGRRLGPNELGLAAAMNHPELPVARRPRVAILATGDELVAPGATPGPDQIVASNSFAVAAQVLAAGGEPIDLGIAADTYDALERGVRAARANHADVLVTLGGASVGDHDLVQSALGREGMRLGFWRIAMRPGKPLIHGRLDEMHILGLPGNPVSAIVCGLLFLSPLVRALCGDPHAGADRSESAVLAAPLPANDSRQDYLRSALTFDGDGRAVATPFARQDSSMLRILAESECLVMREPHAPAAQVGAPCRMLRLDRWLGA